MTRTRFQKVLRLAGVYANGILDLTVLPSVCLYYILYGTEAFKWIGAVFLFFFLFTLQKGLNDKEAIKEMMDEVFR